MTTALATIGSVPLPPQIVPAMLKPVGRATLPGTALTPVFRASFPSLDVPRLPPSTDGSGRAAKPSYSVEAVFHPQADLTELKELIKAALLTKYSPAEIAALSRPGGPLRLPLREQVIRSNLAGYGEEGYFATLRAQEGIPPLLYDTTGGARVAVAREDAAAVFYPGCFCYALISAYAYRNEGRGASFALRVVVKVADGPRLAGAAPVGQSEIEAAFAGVQLPSLADSPQIEGRVEENSSSSLFD